MFKVSIIIPTYNEAKNLPLLVEEIFSSINKNRIDIEIIFVDDNSPDGTGVIAEELKKKFPIHVIHRSGKLGLGSAVREGMNHSKRSIVGVMDADLSHDPKILNSLINGLDEYDITIGGRFAEGSSVEKWVWWRKILTQSGVGLIRWLLGGVKDPLSGYFFIKKSVIDGVNLDTTGYKILFEILVKGKYKKIKEFPYQFRIRKYSSSKLNWREHWLFLRQFIVYTLYRLTHVRNRKTVWEYWKNNIIKNKHIIFLIIFSGILLFYRSSMRTFWMDETAVLQYIKFSPVGFIFEYFRHPDNHPPLYYFLVLICTKILSWNELAIRLVSILSGIGIVVVNYFFAERVLQNKKYAFMVGFFTAFSSFFVLYSQMARYHSLVALSTLGALYFAYRLFVEGYTHRIFVYYIVSAILVGYIDYPHFIYLLILTNIFYAYRVFRRRQWLVSLKKWIISHIVIGAACVPMIWFVYSRIVHQGDHALGITKNLLSNSLENFIAGILIHPYVFFFGENILPWNYGIFTLGVVVLIGSLVGLIRKFLRKEIEFGQKIVLLLGLSLIILNTVFFNIVNPRYNFIVYPKYVMVAFPVWIMLIVIGLSGVYSKKIRTGLYILWFMVSALGLINFYQAKNYLNASYFNTFSSFKFVENNAQPGEYVAITGDANAGVYDFYRTTYFKNLLPLPQDAQGVLPEVSSGVNVWFFVTASDDAVESTATDSKIPPGYTIINRFDSVPLDSTLQKIKEKILHRPSYVYKYSVLLLQKN